MRDEVSAITHLRAVPDKLPLIRPRAEPRAPSPKGEGFPPYKRRTHHDLLPYRKNHQENAGFRRHQLRRGRLFCPDPRHQPARPCPPAGQEGTVYTIIERHRERRLALRTLLPRSSANCFKMLTGVTGVRPQGRAVHPVHHDAGKKSRWPRPAATTKRSPRPRASGRSWPSASRWN